MTLLFIAVPAWLLVVSAAILLCVAARRFDRVLEAGYRARPERFAVTKPTR